MKFERYDNTTAFGADVLEILLQNEVLNNLPVSFIKNEYNHDTSKWLMAAVKDDTGGILLTAVCTPPFNIVLYETGGRQNDAAVSFLSKELKAMPFTLPGVLAEHDLAKRFAEIHAENRHHLHLSMNIMRLDKVSEIQKAPGRCRVLTEDDLFYTPYWERAFGEDCRVEVFDITTSAERIKKRIGRDVHYIWEDKTPVSQAVYGRPTENGAVINGVYTPPHYRGQGYASSVVSELSQMLLDRGNKFCCLFADTQNPISCGIYRKIGYKDLCVFDEIKFNNL